MEDMGWVILLSVSLVVVTVLLIVAVRICCQKAKKLEELKGYIDNKE